MTSDLMYDLSVLEAASPEIVETLYDSGDARFANAQLLEQPSSAASRASDHELLHREPCVVPAQDRSWLPNLDTQLGSKFSSLPATSSPPQFARRWNDRPRSAEPRDSSDPDSAKGCMIVELGDDRFFLAASPAMRDIHKKVCKIARADVAVLITGESGVGKEVVANLLHQQSARASRQFLKINCAALPNDLLESELFGYEAGAFTGAMKSKPGKFEQCAKGTILLDEIGEMSPTLQAKLLHVLQDGEFSRLGARVNTKVDVRIVAATNIKIEEAISERKFREDLYYRLNTFIIHIPPLRERREEIPYLLHELSQRLSKAHDLEPIQFSPRLLAAAVEFSWPGNLRELVNFVKRHLIVRDESSAIQELESKAVVRRPAPAVIPDVMDMTSSPNMKSIVRSLKDQAEIRMIVDTLDETHWNRRIAAERLQISYRALLYKIRQYNLAASN